MNPDCGSNWIPSRCIILRSIKCNILNSVLDLQIVVILLRGIRVYLIICRIAVMNINIVTLCGTALTFRIGCFQGYRVGSWILVGMDRLLKK